MTQVRPGDIEVGGAALGTPWPGHGRHARPPQGHQGHAPSSLSRGHVPVIHGSLDSRRRSHGLYYMTGRRRTQVADDEAKTGRVSLRPDEA